MEVGSAGAESVMESSICDVVVLVGAAAVVRSGPCFIGTSLAFLQ
jgi:hypothetical protein